MCKQTTASHSGYFTSVLLVTFILLLISSTTDMHKNHSAFVVTPFLPYFVDLSLWADLRMIDLLQAYGNIEIHEIWCCCKSHSQILDGASKLW